MCTKLGAALLAAVLLAGCGQSGAPARSATSNEPARDTAAAPAHDMAGMRDSTSAAPGTPGTMAGMDHGDTGDAAHSGMQMPPRSGTTAGMDHSAMAGMDHGPADGGRRGGGGMPAMAGMRHDDGSAGRRRPAMAGMGHAMSGMPAAGSRTGGEHAGMAGMDHSSAGHQQRAARSGDMTGMNHGGMPQGMRMGGGAAQVPADAANEKLLELGSALVRDTAVQRRMREDPALRAGWSDPDVRRVIEGRP